MSWAGAVMSCGVAVKAVCVLKVNVGPTNQLTDKVRYRSLCPKQKKTKNLEITGVDQVCLSFQAKHLVWL